MADSRRIEIVPTERFPADVAGIDADPFAAWGVVGHEHPVRAEDGRWSGALRSTLAVLAGAQPITSWSRSVGTAPSLIVGKTGSTFLRMIDVPGDRLAVTLNGWWWRREEHDDGHLCLNSLREVEGAWSLTGAFRTTAFSRSLAVELLLSPYSRRWTRVELVPRRMIRPNRRYFREGHDALDRFVVGIRAVI